MSRGRAVEPLLMGRNTKESNRRAQAAHTRRLKDAGLVRISLWIRPEDRERVMGVDARRQADKP